MHGCRQRGSVSRGGQPGLQAGGIPSVAQPHCGRRHLPCQWPTGDLVASLDGLTSKTLQWPAYDLIVCLDVLMLKA